MRILLEAKQATFSRAGEAVFRPVDLGLSGGEALVVRGANGSGKTTLLRLLAGILRPASGEVTRHAPVAFLGHHAAVKGDLSCRENLEFKRRFSASASGLSDSRALARVGLAGLGLRPARSLSAGQKRRLGLACLLVAPTAVWLLDEPYASLDDEGCALVDELLSEHVGRDGAAVLSTHQRQPRIGDGRHRTLHIEGRERLE
ncbi:MAG: heme ABC exporter ATP-binding protein CcmA [Gammaproteobacteria bacterium]|jgi:heme exporter protein A|nr:heme ABC exporter ATP-binding protein CcmA [Gammaproteobacteria bacterium]